MWLQRNGGDVWRGRETGGDGERRSDIKFSTADSAPARKKRGKIRSLGCGAAHKSRLPQLAEPAHSRPDIVILQVETWLLSVFSLFSPHAGIAK